MQRSRITASSASFVSAVALVLATAFVLAAAEDDLPGPPPDAEQLPRRMHQAMKVRPLVRVGVEGGDLVGRDHRVLQAAVDYVAALGGGTVEIGPGVFTMRDSLHLRAGVTVRGAGSTTVLEKAPAVVSALRLDGDFGEEQITVETPDGFEVGYGVAIRDDAAGGFHTTVATITGKDGHTFAISRPLMADCLASRGGRAATVFPVISGYGAEGAVVESLAIDGSKESNIHLNGCRGAGIFLYRSHGAVIRDCLVRDYNGDGISFQQSNDVQVLRCASEGNTQLGLHPGSGSQRPKVISCIARGNGSDGLFLCWRVRHGLFEGNELIGNGGHGISIGHKDTDNTIVANVVRENDQNGIYFRNESAGMAGHRNRLVRNVIENNARAGIRIDGETEGIVIVENKICDTRPEDERTQRRAISIGKRAGEVTLEKNEIQAEVEVEDERKAGGN